MIKLIASDMDGTLLDAEGNVPPETFELISGLRRCGVHFVASSGRRFDTLSEQFAPVVDLMDFDPHRDGPLGAGVVDDLRER